jgi:hypothetical protein
MISEVLTTNTGANAGINLVPALLQTLDASFEKVWPHSQSSANILAIRQRCAKLRVSSSCSRAEQSYFFLRKP